jgi:serine/threonine protein kinase
MTIGRARRVAMSTHFLIHDRVAAGGMGVVHAGTMVSSAGRRRVAIKRLTAEGAMSQAARARLVAEARLVFQLTHRNICQVLDLGAGDHGAYIVMEFVDGLDLRALLRQLAAAGGRLDVASCVYIARDVAQALDYAHRRTADGGDSLDLVHGDVTPGNILLSVEGEVKLTDFGIARALGTTAPGTHLSGGTPGFVAPECDAGVVDHRSDIYSLGVTLYTALSGSDPDDGVSPASLRRRRPEVSAELEQVVRRMTAARPADRFLSAAEVEQVLALELARRYPTFTPSTLARVVRAHAAGPAGPATSIGTLTSLTTAAFGDPASDPITIPDPPAAPRDPHSTTSDHARSLTRTSRSARRSPRVAWIVASLAVAAAAMLVTLWLSRRGPAVGPAIDAGAVAAASPQVPPTPASPAIDAAPLAAEPARPRPVRSRPSEPREKRAYITVNSIPWGAVYVDGRKVSSDTPLYRHPLAAGRHEVKVFFPDRGTYSAPRRVDLAPGAVETLGFHP